MDHTEMMQLINRMDEEREAAYQEGRKSLGREICIGLKQRGFWAPHDIGSADVINAVFIALQKQQDSIEKLERSRDMLENAEPERGGER